MPPWQPRHEDILGTFLFFLITGFALFQIMIGYRRTRGLSFYGSTIRPAVNYSVGLVLLTGGFAWYFANPDNRNVPGIEGFMSLVCMALGIIAAVLLSVLLAAISRGIRRRGQARSFRTMNRGGVPNQIWRTLYVGREGTLMILTPVVVEGNDITVLICDVDGITRLPRLLAGALAGTGHRVTLLAPSYFTGGAQEAYDSFVFLLSRLAAEQRSAAGDDLVIDMAGLGLGADLVSHAPPEGPGWTLRKRLLLNPRRSGDPGTEHALHTMTPVDVAAIAWRERIWTTPRMRRLGFIVGVSALACVLAGTTTTFILGVRWWPVSGTLAGLLASVWIAYLYIFWRHPAMIEGGYEHILAAWRSEVAEQPHPDPLVVLHVRFSPRMLSEALRGDIDRLLQKGD